MALKKIYLDRRTEVGKTSSYVNLENRLDLNAHIEKVVEVSDGFDSILVDSITEKTAANGVDVEGVNFTDNVISDVRTAVEVMTAASYTLTAADSGKHYVLSRAGGIDVDLPEAQAGLTFKFTVLTAVSGDLYTITAQAGDLLVGGVLSSELSTGTPEAAVIFQPDVSDDLIISLNGTDTGGLRGTTLTLTALNGTRWMVEGVLAASGTLATPFS